MHKNMNSPNKLTEFAPLSPEESPPAVTSIFSKIFSFGKSSSPSNSEVPTPIDDKKSLQEDSQLWDKQQSPEKSPSDDSKSFSSYSLDSSEGRSLPNVLKRISNIVSYKSSNLQSYENSQLRSFWMPDSVSKQCYECGERFTTFRRRHHCRICGQIFCSKCCSDEVPGKIMGCTGDLRVCTYCCKVVLSYLQSSDLRSALSADLKALQEGLEEKYGNTSQPMKKMTEESEINESIPKRKSSVGYMEEKYAFGRSQNYLTSKEKVHALQSSTSLRMIYEEMFRSSQAITLQTHRIRLNRYFNCFLGNEMVNWLINQKTATTRIQASALGQALFEAGFIESVLNESTFTDSASLFRPAKLSRVQSKEYSTYKQPSCDAPEPAWVKTIPQHDSTTDSDSETKFIPGSSSRITNSSSYYLNLDIEASTVSLKKPLSDESVSSSMSESVDEVIEHKEVNFQNHDVNSKVPEDLLNDKLLVQESKGKSGWHRAINLKNSLGEANAYSHLNLAYKQHQDSLICQLLNKEALSQKWSEIILEIADQVIDHIRPDLNRNMEDMDVRQYVQIKKSPGCSKDDCEIVSGVVCTKNVAHKSMNAMIANPKILLLGCGITYQRVEGKLLSLDPILLQESQFLGHAVARINSLGPDIVLTHKSMARVAQDKLRESGVTLVLNVKLSILERLARCTGADIVDTVDAHMSTMSRLGKCKKFYLRNFPCEKNGIKTLMFFEGCDNPHLGATILLRGGSENELKKVKKVTSMMIFAAYSNRLEKSFLMDEFAQIPSSKNNSFLDESSRQSSPNKTTKSICAEQDTSSFLDVRKKSSDNNESAMSGDEQGIDSVQKSTPMKSNQMEQQSRDDEHLSQDAVLLMKSSNSYDTLRLFKGKSKINYEKQEKTSLPEIDDGSIDLDNSASLFTHCAEDHITSETLQLKEKHLTEEKKVHADVISDKSDPLHQYLNEGEIDAETLQNQISPIGQCLSVAELPLLNTFKKSLEGTILSFSPYMKFSVPYLETELGRNCTLRSYFPKEIYYSTYFSDKIEVPKLMPTGELIPSERSLKDVVLLSPHPFILAKLTQPADSRDVQNMLANFRACGGRLPKIVGDKAAQRAEKRLMVKQETIDPQPTWPDCLDPVNHQRLSVLFCSFLRNTSLNNTASFCVNPWIVNMDLYGRNDIALGRFLERYCLANDYKCPGQGCRAQIAQHVRRFVHDGGCLFINLCEMTTDPFSHLSQNNPMQIYTWSKCTKCKSVSPVVPISDDTWSLSFAKYLELRFYGSAYTRRGSDNSCLHSLHQDHQQYFSRCNMLATMRYSKISQWEIALPPPLIIIKYESKLQDSIVEEMKFIALKGDEVFSCAKEKIYALQLDDVSTDGLFKQLTKDQLSFKNKMEELQLIITSPVKDKKLHSKQTNNLQKNLLYRIEDRIVFLKRLIAETVSSWNGRIVEASVRKKDEKTILTPLSVRKPQQTHLHTETDGYVTDDAVSESQIEDVSSVTADYNAIEAISSTIEKKNEDYVQSMAVASEQMDISESATTSNPENIVVIQGLPKSHPKLLSEVLPSEEILMDKKKKMKTILSQVWSSSPNVNTISNPFGPSEHHLLSLGSVVPIVVHELEPSSIIAYALDSHDYKHALSEPFRSSRGVDLNPSPLNKRKLQENKEGTTELTQSVESKRPSVLSYFRGNSPNPNSLSSPMDIEKSAPTSETSQTLSAGSVENEEDKKGASKQQQQNYIEVQFADSTTNFYCRIYFAAQFAALRENVLPYGEEGFTRSLSHSVQWAARGGKSGSTFSKTKDDRFILKEMNRVDLQIFLDFAPNYFAYMEKCQQTKQPTLLGKIVGIYRVSFKNNSTNAALRTSLLVMENLFYNRSITDKFDLKGSVRNRLVNLEDVDHEGELVLLDENLLNMSCDSPLYIRLHAKAVLNKAIEEDTKFLADNCVMDYSLLVGLEPNSDELVIGIIDYLRTFTWDKKIETIVKKSGILGGQGKLPTIVSPDEYRARFIAAMHKYFLPVPDRWTGLSRGVITT